MLRVRTMPIQILPCILVDSLALVLTVAHMHWNGVVPPNRLKMTVHDVLK